MLNKLFILLNYLTNNFFTYVVRPKLNKDYHKVYEAFDHSQLGVIIQGNIPDVNFLLETIKLYKKKNFSRCFDNRFNLVR